MIEYRHERTNVGTNESMYIRMNERMNIDKNYSYLDTNEILSCRDISQIVFKIAVINQLINNFEIINKSINLSKNQSFFMCN